jgi:hypothetical protein
MSSTDSKTWLIETNLFGPMTSSSLAHDDARVAA